MVSKLRPVSVLPPPSYQQGFGTKQDMVIASQMGCSDQEKCYSEGGMDVATAEAICAHECNIKLPRDEGGIHYAFLDGCGGHTKVRNGHERQGKEREGRIRERGE